MCVNILITYRYIKHKGKALFGNFTPHLLNKRGQSLIEFLLLFSILIGVSTFFYNGAITNISHLWEGLLNLVIDDQNNKIKFGN